MSSLLHPASTEVMTTEVEEVEDQFGDDGEETAGEATLSRALYSPPDKLRFQCSAAGCSVPPRAAGCVAPRGTKRVVSSNCSRW